MKLDHTDRTILRRLQVDGRMTNAELAKQVGISPPATLERVKKLEKGGVIRKYAALVEPSAVGVDTFTLVEVTLSRHGKDAVTAFLEATRDLPEILEIHHVTGDADFVLKIAVRSLSVYERFVLNTLTDLPYIQHLKTMVVLSTIKNETGLIIEEDPDNDRK